MGDVGGENSSFPPGLAVAHTVTLSDVARIASVGGGMQMWLPSPRSRPLHKPERRAETNLTRSQCGRVLPASTERSPPRPVPRTFREVTLFPVDD